jgi:hypothetical protein
MEYFIYCRPGNSGVYLLSFTHDRTIIYYIFKSILEVVMWSWGLGHLPQISCFNHSWHFFKSKFKILLGLQRHHSLFLVLTRKKPCAESKMHLDMLLSLSCREMTCRWAKIASLRSPGELALLFTLGGQGSHCCCWGCFWRYCCCQRCCCCFHCRGCTCCLRCCC